MNNSIRVVLVETSHPGNIGATARAMKNMGLEQLYLVNPAVFPHNEASARAAGADDVLKEAVVCQDLDSAIADCTLVYGSSARERTLPWPLITPKECAQKIQQKDQQSIALVFGRERNGLNNEELAKCHAHVHIPTNPDFSSLNLAQAVQVLVYEVYQAGLQQQRAENSSVAMATSAQVTGFLDHLYATMTQVGMMKLDGSKMLRRRLQRLFYRSQLEVEEVNILRGFLSAVEKKL